MQRDGVEATVGADNPDSPFITAWRVFDGLVRIMFETGRCLAMLQTFYLRVERL